MNRKSIVLALVLSATLAAVLIAAAGCGDDEIFRNQDTDSFDGGPRPEAGPGPQLDGGDGAPPTCGDNGKGSPERLLLSMNNATTSELVAFNVADQKVDGRYTYAGFIGLATTQGPDPYLLEQATDLVARLDPQRPWEVRSTWNVAGNDQKDGGFGSAQPVAVVVADCAKAYVIRFGRNKIGVIDTTKTADAGLPESFIDLAPLLQDPDGLVEMTNAVYVPAKKRIYVLLANADLSSAKFVPPNYDLLCSSSKPSIVAIDTVSGALVSLGGTAPGGGISLSGYNPPLGPSLAYDAARDRLLVLHAGCNQDVGGAAGPMQQRRVEEVDLATGLTKTLLSLDDKNFPTGMVFVDGTHAALSFAGPVFGALGKAFFWDPSKTTIGEEIPGGFDYGGHDGKGHLIGVRSTKLDGGAAGPIDVVSVPLADGGAAVDAAAIQTLGQNPFTDNSGLLSGAETWPRP